ncbi:hypothetical protein IWQ60_002497 [Tieghemiomyces parasiticus]|uniref:Uncharacterized protein n=1 Tax=Tieghemiomyces parasiticus TaxID=78921 RepID=A0A9W8AF15_9FUNG|nr:hypothetical protein IWQ60_002497 [Tieghemiomyces parasiticus]
MPLLLRPLGPSVLRAIPTARPSLIRPHRLLTTVPMRLFIVPIFQDHWGYHCQSSVRPAGRLGRLVEYASAKWEGLAAAQHDSWRRRLYDAGTRLMDKIDYHEWFLKAVPAQSDLEDAKGLPLHFPRNLDPARVRTRLAALASERTPYHKRYLWLSCLWLPLTLAFGIIPFVPNLPLFYNLFRIYSHYRAYQGASHLETLIRQDRLAYGAPEPVLERYAASFALTADSPLSETIIRGLAHELDLPTLELALLRAQHQIVQRAVAAGEYTLPATEGAAHIDMELPVGQTRPPPYSVERPDTMDKKDV